MPSEDKLREAAKVARRLPESYYDADALAAELDRILGYSELAAAIREVLICAWKYDDKPHHLFTAIIRLAETLPDEFTPEIRRLMSEAYNAAGPRSELLEQRDKLVEALRGVYSGVADDIRAILHKKDPNMLTTLPVLYGALQKADKLLRDLEGK